MGDGSAEILGFENFVVDFMQHHKEDYVLMIGKLQQYGFRSSVALSLFLISYFNLSFTPSQWTRI